MIQCQGFAKGTRGALRCQKDAVWRAEFGGAGFQYACDGCKLTWSIGGLHWKYFENTVGGDLVVCQQCIDGVSHQHPTKTSVSYVGCSQCNAGEPHVHDPGQIGNRVVCGKCDELRTALFELIEASRTTMEEYGHTLDSYARGRMQESIEKAQKVHGQG